MSLSGWTFQNVSTGFPIGAGNYREDINSGDGTFSEEGSETSRVFVTDWGQWPSFVADVLGYPSFGGVTGVQRVLPEAHPICNNFYASSCKVKVAGVAAVSGGASTWKVARIETTFRPVTYAVLADGDIGSELDRYVTRRTHNKGDYLQLSINSFKWVSRPQVNGQPQPLGATPGIIAPSKLAEYEWHNLPAKPVLGGDQNLPYRCPMDSAIPLYLGTVNSTTFDGIYPAGTVLFTAAEAELTRPVLANGVFTWRIKYYFEIKDNGFVTRYTGGPAINQQAGCNFLFDPMNSRWDLVTTNANVNGQKLYNSADLNELFVIPVP